MYVTPTLIGMANDRADPQIAILCKILPIMIGETVPFGHSLNDPLPECTLYSIGFVAWFKSLHWAFIKNNKKSITNKDGDIFNAFNRLPTLTDDSSPGETVLNHAKGADLEVYFLEVTPILSTSKPYKLSVASTEISASSKLDNYNFADPSTDPKVQQV